MNRFREYLEGKTNPSERLQAYKKLLLKYGNGKNASDEASLVFNNEKRLQSGRRLRSSDYSPDIECWFADEHDSKDKTKMKYLTLSSGRLLDSKDIDKFMKMLEELKKLF